MSTYLDKLIEGVKQELGRERERIEHATFRQKTTEMRELGPLKRLEQRLAVLEQLKVKETVSRSRRAAASARNGRPPGEASPRQRRRRA
jgi:hypothetical protein